MLNAVIVVDDEASIRTAVEQWLSLSGFDVQLFSRAEACLAQLPKDFPGVVLSDVRMPGLSGLELLAEVRRRDADLPVILLTGHGDVPMAVEAMRDGAYDFLEKPFSPEALLNSLRRALDKRGLILENRRLHQQADHRTQLENSLLGVSRSMQNLRRQVLDLATLPVNVLIRGETGSGKELVARCLHDFGPRRRKPLSRSIARQSPSSCLKPSCSATRAARLPALRASVSASWNTPTVARCFWMKSKACPWPSKSNCCGCCRSRSWSAWAPIRASTSICASSLRPNRTCWKKPAPDVFAKTWPIG